MNKKYPNISTGLHKNIFNNVENQPLFWTRTPKTQINLCINQSKDMNKVFMKNMSHGSYTHGVGFPVTTKEILGLNVKDTTKKKQFFFYELI